MCYRLSYFGQHAVFVKCRVTDFENNFKATFLKAVLPNTTALIDPKVTNLFERYLMWAAGASLFIDPRVNETNFDTHT